MFTQAVFMGQRCVNDHAHVSGLRLGTWHRTFIISPDCQAPGVDLCETVSTLKHSFDDLPKYGPRLVYHVELNLLLQRLFDMNLYLTQN